MKGEILKRIDQIQHLEYTFSLYHFKISFGGEKRAFQVCAVYAMPVGGKQGAMMKICIYTVSTEKMVIC